MAATRPQLPTFQQDGFGYQQHCPPNTMSVLPRHSQQCCNTYLPRDTRHAYPAHGCAFPRLPHGSALKPPSTASSISRSHGRRCVVLAKRPWVCSWYYSHLPQMLCKPGLAPAVKPSTADGSASKGKHSIFYPS